MANLKASIFLHVLPKSNKMCGEDVVSNLFVALEDEILAW